MWKEPRAAVMELDRKSTRLNSSHDQISYAVFCLKKKEHTSELQSRSDLVCRLLLEKKLSASSQRLALMQPKLATELTVVQLYISATKDRFRSVICGIAL